MTLATMIEENFNEYRELSDTAKEYIICALDAEDNRKMCCLMWDMTEILFQAYDKIRPSGLLNRIKKIIAYIQWRRQSREWNRECKKDDLIYTRVNEAWKKTIRDKQLHSFMSSHGFTMCGLQ